jgi:hypothetical protein
MRVLRYLPLFFAAACSSAEMPEGEPVLVEGECVIGGETPDYLSAIACKRDFEALASEPLDTSIPGARSVKVVVDRFDRDAIYFQNSRKYPIHHEFASANLSGGSRPIVPSLSEFNLTEYYSPDRRFLLGAVTYYEGAAAWTLELAPYDTASPEMITALYEAVKAVTWFGPGLKLHPTSEAVALTAKSLPASVRVITTGELYEGIDYQPLNLAIAVGRLRFIDAIELETTYVSFREIVVMDHAPNDISVVSGIITEEFQTPLSHINVLSRNRKTPNMGLRGARANETLRALEGKWVRLEVGEFAWSATETTGEEAERYWELHKPAPVILPAVDLSVTDLRDIEDVVDEASGPLREAIKTAVNAFGGKAAHYSILAKTEGVPARKAFAVPAFYYVDFMERNGLFAQLDALLADQAFQDSPEVRDTKLAELRAAIESAPIDPAFQEMVRAKMAADYPGLTMRFRSSTNSEDLDGFPCAGCYESHTGDPADWNDVLDAIRETWSSIFLFRTFEEREYNSIDHKSVVMALLVHHNFPDEEANGVAITANPFDPSGLQPGFYINVQFGGDVEVVHPPPGTTSDQIVYLFDQPGQPVIYLSHSNIIPAGTTVLTHAQLFELGGALSAIHRRFSPAYGPAAGNNGWYAMDVEFKFDGEPGETPRLAVKQARPYPGRGE